MKPYKKFCSPHLAINERGVQASMHSQMCVKCSGASLHMQHQLQPGDATYPDSCHFDLSAQQTRSTLKPWLPTLTMGSASRTFAPAVPIVISKSKSGASVNDTCAPDEAHWRQLVTCYTRSQHRLQGHTPCCLMWSFGFVG